MKIPFMMQFPWGEKTHFIEKLWAMRTDDEIEYLYNNYEEQAGNYGILMQSYCWKPKIHTIRNKSDRFKVGQNIQPFVWTYKPYKQNPNPKIPAQFDFMPPLKIINKQKIEFWSYGGLIWPFIDGRELTITEAETLAINDGFSGLDQFSQYFNKPLENMEIRHFTSLKY